MTNEMLLETNESVIITDEAQRVINLLNGAVSQTEKTVTFLGMRNYCNQKGEKSNYLINLGIDYNDQKNKDIQFLRELDITKGTWQSNLVTLEQARTELIESFINPDKARSEGQKEAYTHICKGLKVHNDKGTLHIYGYCVKNTIIEESTEPKKVVNSKPLTIAKNELRKLLKTGGFVNFVVSVGNTIKVSGETLNLDV